MQYLNPCLELFKRKHAGNLTLQNYNFYQSIQHKISEALNIHGHFSKKLKSRKVGHGFIQAPLCMLVNMQHLNL